MSKKHFYLSTISESFIDYPDFKNMCVNIFFSGCTHNCNGCQNKNINKPKSGKKIEIKYLLSQIKTKSIFAMTNKLSILGGEPLQQKNINILLSKLYSLNYDLCLYTGYNYDDALKIIGEHIYKLKFIKTGVFNNEKYQTPKKDESNKLFILASKNQELRKIENKKIIKISNNGIAKLQ